MSKKTYDDIRSWLAILVLWAAAITLHLAPTPNEVEKLESELATCQESK
jgi:hypothetical protein